MFKNTPYRKIYENGILVNPITKKEPYTQVASQKEGKRIRKSNNRKGNGLVVAKVGVVDFVKYKIIKQIAGNKLIVHSVLKN